MTAAALVLLVLADYVILHGSHEKIAGRIIEADGVIRINAYWSAHPEMTLGVREVPAASVRLIRRTVPSPSQQFQIRLACCRNADDFRELAKWCEPLRLDEEREYALELAKRRESPEWRQHFALARAFLRDPSTAPPTDRPGFPFDERYLRRAVRSAAQPLGLIEDRPLAWAAERLPDGGRYALLVPESYDPLRPTPLVIGLHGGGAGGADGKRVVGTGADALNQFHAECARRGWLLACPTALAGGWDLRPNHRLIDALLDEMRALYNVDEGRTYLVGHSMGGAGVWFHSDRLRETWAAAAAASSYGVRGRSPKCPIYVYHGALDVRTPVAQIRPHLEGRCSPQRVYTELPDRGHELTPDIVRDMFDFLEPRRQGGCRPRSSFRRTVSPAERRYLPGDRDRPAPLKDLLSWLAEGSFRSEIAVGQLSVLEHPKASARVAKVLLRPSSNARVRSNCARILAARGAVDQVDALCRVLVIETDPSAVETILSAIAEIGGPSAGVGLATFVQRRALYLERLAEGKVIDQADWSAVVPGLALACDLLGTYRPRRAAAVIRREVVERLLLSDLEVGFDRELQWPLPAARALATAACDALARIGDRESAAVLERMLAAGGAALGATVIDDEPPLSRMGEFCADPMIAAAARHALATLRG